MAVYSGTLRCEVDSRDVTGEIEIIVTRDRKREPQQLTAMALCADLLQYSSHTAKLLKKQLEAGSWRI